MRSASAWLAAHWVRIYTCGMSMDERMARRDEIAADIWDHVNDRSVVHGTSGLLSRVIAGMPADVAWSYQARGGMEGVLSMTSDRLSIQRNVAVGLWAGVLVLVLAGVVILAGTTASTVLVMAAVGIGGAMVVRRTFATGVNEGVVTGKNGISRTVLVVVLLASISLIVGTALIAFNDKTWGDTEAIVYNLLGLIGLLGILWSAVMLVAKSIRRATN